MQSSAERQELEATLSSTPSSEDASTTVVSSLQEMTVDSEDSIDPQCQDLDELEIHANPENCGEYFIFCVRPVSQEIASQSEAILSGPTSQIKVLQYNATLLKQDKHIHFFKIRNNTIFINVHANLDTYLMELRNSA